MPPDARVAVGVSVVVERDGRRLMVRRGGSEWYADGRGTWAHPGGWLDFGETPAQTAVREVVEETGVVVRHRNDDLASRPHVFGTWANANDAGTIWIINLFLICDYVSGEPTVMEPVKCPEVAWVPIGEVESLPLFGATRTFHEMLKAA